MTNWIDEWPAGRTWVFQGTVAEDGTGGTHVCSLTVTPGAGNELRVLYGRIVDGATATAQTVIAFIDDGTNILHDIMNAQGAPDTVSNSITSFPLITQTTVPATTTFENSSAGPELIVSGTMRVKLQVTTTAVSVTQTFAIVCRIKGGLPTATLADTVGTPVLTTNTNQTFG